MSTATTTTSLPAGTWHIDTHHSEVAFTVRHLMSKVRGTFENFAGTITTVEGDPTQSKVQATVEMSSVNTRSPQRDGHLRSSEIFNAETNPQMTFRSTKITEDDGSYVITGDLTINGVTKQQDFAAEFLGVDVDMANATRLGVEATTTIVRKDFGVDFNIPLDGGKFVIGDKAQVTLTIEAVLA
ncbi:YceI family protein [Microlunatus sp. Y2014]|uniref:YceI family protein n=1 Tax=Microlunatus sp. Y2014 TaxID=3418488 RepID=UPI003DA72039